MTATSSISRIMEWVSSSLSLQTISVREIDLEHPSPQNGIWSRTSNLSSLNSNFLRPLDTPMMISLSSRVGKITDTFLALFTVIALGITTNPYCLIFLVISNPFLDASGFLILISTISKKLPQTGDGRFVSVVGLNLETIPVAFYKEAHSIESLNMSRNPRIDFPLDFAESCTNLTTVNVSDERGIEKKGTEHVIDEFFFFECCSTDVRVRIHARAQGSDRRGEPPET